MAYAGHRVHDLDDDEQTQQANYEEDAKVDDILGHLSNKLTQSVLSPPADRIGLVTPADGNNITVAQVEKVFECLKGRKIPDEEVRKLINRLVPFSKSIPGTNVYFKNEQKKLMSIIASPVYKDHPWTWFVTMSNADIFEEYIDRILYSDGNGIAVDGHTQLSRTERAALLRVNPALASRTFMLKQELLLDYIRNSKGLPLGPIEDIWVRVEFQRSWNAHLHYILSMRGSGNVGNLLDSENVSINIYSIISHRYTYYLPHASITKQFIYIDDSFITHYLISIRNLILFLLTPRCFLSLD